MVHPGGQRRKAAVWAAVENLQGVSSASVQSAGIPGGPGLSWFTWPREVTHLGWGHRMLLAPSASPLCD